MRAYDSNADMGAMQHNGLGDVKSFVLAAKG